MLPVFALLFFCSALGWLYTKAAPCAAYMCGSTDPVRRGNIRRAARCVFWLLVAVLIWFGGLRTVMNDTATYTRTFRERIPWTLDGIRAIKWSVFANPLFHAYQILLKSLVSRSENVFLLVTTAFTTISFTLFFRKYSTDFGASLFIFIAFTVYATSLAAMKQVIATSIAIWAIPLHLNGRKLRAWLLIGIAMLFHSYVFILAVGFFLEKDVWDRRTALIIFTTFIVILGFDTLISLIVTLVSSVGKNYSKYISEFGGHTSLPRVLTYLTVPILSFCWRERLRDTGNRYVYTFVNLCTVSACFSAISRCGLSILTSRLPEYFDCFICIALPMVLRYGVRRKRDRQLIWAVAIPLYCIFYFTYYLKYTAWPIAEGVSPLTYDFYKRISLWQLLKGW